MTPLSPTQEIAAIRLRILKLEVTFSEIFKIAAEGPADEAVDKISSLGSDYALLTDEEFILEHMMGARDG